MLDPDLLLWLLVLVLDSVKLHFPLFSSVRPVLQKHAQSEYALTLFYTQRKDQPRFVPLVP